ncbi:nuclear transport factor 2-like [Rutidosis leptorrhynchoides]|uniref:nuclear transport factor 2-like n=1 Tax=Rutidosis leptorrhynchoides TaxID=125765 RepID=UPI003A99D02F
MATPFHLPVTAAQVGTYFVGHYYQVLQTQPDYVHQFYSDRSTLLRVDGHNRETATSMLQIHALVMSLNYTGIEIKTVHALESWDRGVLVLVAGSVHIKDFSSRRNFVQTFFLAPQEKGYFVLNDIFQFIDDQPIHHLPVAYMTQNDLVSTLNTSTGIREQASSYMASGDMQARDFVPTTTLAENGNVNGYSFQEQKLQATEPESIHKDNYATQTNGSVPNSVNALQDHSTPVVEVVGEPPKHTYASILQVAKGHPAPSVPKEQAMSKSTTASDLNHVYDSSAQQSTAPPTVERSGAETIEDDDEGEAMSVYVKNVSSTTTAFEIEEEFKKFGKIKRDGVAIRTRKDLDVCYAFVEFEDISGVHNAIKASTVEIGGQQVFIEGRRANKNNVYRAGRGRGRGSRGGYQTDGRGRFGGRNYNRANGHDGNDHREFNRSRGNGHYRQSSRQDRTYSNSRNGHSASD